MSTPNWLELVGGELQLPRESLAFFRWKYGLLPPPSTIWRPSGLATGMIQISVVSSRFVTVASLP
jgi:hypothetical protein